MHSKDTDHEIVAEKNKRQGSDIIYVMLTDEAKKRNVFMVNLVPIYFLSYCSIVCVVFLYLYSIAM